MSFRGRLLVAMLGLVTLVAGGILVGLEFVVRREIVVRLSEDLDATAAGLSNQLQRDLGRLTVEARVASEEPRIKALLNTEGIDAETLADAADETRRSTGWDLLGLTTVDGSVRALTGHPSGGAMPALVTGALERGEVTGYWADGERLYRGAALPVRLADHPIGALLVGDRLDDAEVTRLGRQGSIAFAVFSGSRLVASPFTDSGRRGQLAAVGSRTPSELLLGEENFLARAVPLGSSGIHAVVLSSEESALRPYRRLRLALLGVGLGALGLAAVLATALSRGMSRPLAHLATLVGEVGAGNLEVRIQPGGAREIDALGRTFNTMVEEIARSREERAHAEALHRELEIARTIQTGILPHDVGLAGFEVAAWMRPATEVGGDYYELVPLPQGFWILVGDVSGHGLNSGLLMLILQAAALSALTASPDVPPRQLIHHLNRVFHAELARMKANHYATLMALRHLGGGRFVAAGGHQPLFVVRDGGSRVEVIESTGPWCGFDAGLEQMPAELSFELAPGDWLWLVTDGVLEAKDPARQMFGDERLAAALKACAGRPPAEALAEVFATIDRFTARFTAGQEDDMTLLALRRTPEDRHG